MFRVYVYGGSTDAAVSNSQIVALSDGTNNLWKILTTIIRSAAEGVLRRKEKSKSKKPEVVSKKSAKFK